MRDYNLLNIYSRNVNWRVQLITLTILTFMVNLAVLLSLWSIEKRILFIAIFNVIFTLCAVTILLAKSKLKNIVWLNRIYFAAALLFNFTVMAFNAANSNLVNMILLTVLISTVILSFSICFLKILLGIYALQTVYFWIRMPSFTITMGPGYYIFILAVLLSSYYAFKQIIVLFQRYDREIRSRVETTMAQTEQIRQMALTDPLTGVPNRQALISRLDEMLGNRSGFPVIKVFLIDYDNFKYLNNTFGYAFGDQVLQKITATVAGSRQPELEIFARTGGNSFAFILTRDWPCDQFVNWIRSHLRRMIVNNIEINLSCSIGVALAGPDLSADRAEALLKNAEIALYNAKEHGQNLLTEYSLQIADELNERLKLTGEFETALQQGEFCLVYQPILRGSDSAIVGFEALARWHSPKYGAIAPLDFINHAEKTGFIQQLGYFILRSACQFATAINENRADHDRLTVSVNLSAVQLLSLGSEQRLLELIHEFAVPRGSLAIEITETAFMNDRSTISEKLKTLHDQGITVALDDFGTGYSSLSYLANLPVDRLKIDKSFIDPLTNRQREYEVVRLILEIAHLFHMECVAEGVENMEQYLLLRALGCHYIQGFYISEPMTGDEVRQLLASGETNRIRIPVKLP